MQRSRQQILRARGALALTVTIVGGGLAWVIYSLPKGTWQAWVESVPPLTLLAALTVLPIFGFPISVLHVATGARFGLVVGTLAVAVSTLGHLLATYVGAKLLNRPLRRLLSTLGWRLPAIPAAMAWSFGFWIALLPGVSYALKNVVPPLAAMSLRVYLGTAFPVHVATSLIGLGIGRATIEFSWTLVTVVAIYGAFLAVLTRQLAKHFRAPPIQNVAPVTVALTRTPGHRPPVDDPR